MTAYNNKSGHQKVAIIIENGVEDTEFLVPLNGLKQAQFDVAILGSRINEKYTGKRGKVSLHPQGTTTEAIVSEFDAVVIPGGMSLDKMRRNSNTVHFVIEAMQQGKLIAAVGNGLQVLIEGDLLRGKQATGCHAIRKDMMNAGADYINQPLVVDGNLITSRQPGDLAMFTTAILNRLGYSGKEAALPLENDRNAEWWKVADAWGGSTKSEIVKGLNIALAGGRYSLEALETYAVKESDAQIKSLFYEMIQCKWRHIQKLDKRLAELKEKPSIAANLADKYAKVKTALQGSDDIYQLRCALGDVQTAIGDLAHLCVTYTDPVTTEVFADIYQDLLIYEQRLAELYRMRTAPTAVSATPPKGTPVAV
jgi:protease I